jgi:hypothetical protein
MAGPCWRRLVITCLTGDYTIIPFKAFLTLHEQRPDPKLGTTVELGFLGTVYQVELPVGLEEHQMPQTTTIPLGGVADQQLHVSRFLTPSSQVDSIRPEDVGYNASTISTTSVSLRSFSLSSVVNMGMSYSLRAAFGLWIFACHDKSRSLVAS